MMCVFIVCCLLVVGNRAAYFTVVHDWLGQSATETVEEGPTYATWLTKPSRQWVGARARVGGWGWHARTYAQTYKNTHKHSHGRD